MITDSAQLEILRRELEHANETIDFLRQELLFQARDLSQVYDRFYDAIVLLASCESCNGESLRWLQDQCSSSDYGSMFVELAKRDIRNGRLLSDAGIDLESFGLSEGEGEGQEEDSDV